MAKNISAYRRKVQDALSAELGAKLTGEITGRVKNQNFKISLGDSIKGVYVDIVDETTQNSNAIIQNSKSQHEIAKILFQRSGNAEYILVFENELSEHDRKYYNENLTTQVTGQKIPFYDSQDIERIYQNYFDITPTYKWYDVYPVLVDLFVGFANVQIKRRRKPGVELYKLLSVHPAFIKHNTWFANFGSTFSVKSLDPIHLFTSFNSNKLNNKNRIDRINILMDFFKTNTIYKKINFDGCPTPTAVSILASRKQEYQDSIWALFLDVSSKKKIENLKKYFETYKLWYGVEFSAFTQFLFWIKSDKFLPIEYNVKAWLAANDIRFKIPDDFDSYEELINNIEEGNKNYNGIKLYGEEGLFREITHAAYRIINLGEKEIEVSFSYQDWSVSNQKGNYEKLKNPRRLDQGLLTEIQDEQTRPSDNENKTQTKFDTSHEAELGKLGFKVIAIKILDGTDQEHIGILKTNIPYHFEKTILITENEIQYFPEKNINIYSISRGTEILRINFTAVVGKNGSGKSSLIEFFFKIINVVSCKHNEALKTKYLTSIENFNAELYFIIDGILHKILLFEEKMSLEEFRLEDSKFVSFHKTESLDQQFFKKFFYSIAVNYSHYALNSKEIGIWIKGLFHKNDGYQTPLVINPMRTEGNIDINRENELANSRLISNLLSPSEGTDEFDILRITENQIAESIDFEINKKKVEFVFKSELTGNWIRFSNLKTKPDEIMGVVREVFSIPLKGDKTIGRKGLTKIAEKYIVKKVIQISLTYPHYSAFSESDLKFKSIDDLKKFVVLLRDDPSHISFKLRQAINYLVFPEIWMTLGNQFSVSINSKRTDLAAFNSTKLKRNPIELVVPSFFKGKIMLRSLVKPDEKPSEFKRLSSGEKQLIHSIHSILYHLINIDSVRHLELVSYNKINIILDEIELYYHPDLQRRFISTLLRMLKTINLTKINALNFLMITHSPYILSDIPGDFILKLDKGIAIANETLTFGANIHELLTLGFFLEDGFIGEHAKNLINELIEDISGKESIDKIESEKFHELINIIGEPFIRQKLHEMVVEKTKVSAIEKIDRLIQVGQIEIQRLIELKRNQTKDDSDKAQ